MLKGIWKGVLRVLRIIGHIQAFIILSIFYYLILSPVALISKLLSDPLHLRLLKKPIWRARPLMNTSLKQAKAQF